MKLSIIAVGTRGDVRPLVALGKELRHRGHQVRLTAGDEYASLVQAAGLEFVPLGVEMHRLIPRYRDFYALTNELRGRILEAAGRGQDAYIASLVGVPICSLAREQGVPFYYASLIPTLPTRAFAHPLLPPLPLGGAYNLLTYRMADRVARRACPDTAWVLDEPRPPYLCAFSEQVVPRPPEWGDFAHITGYWFLSQPADYQPPAELEEFIHQGPPPLAAGFGSAETGQGRRTADLVMAALAQTGQRGILLTGWGSPLINAPPPNVYVIEAVPYDWLFPRVAAVIHHGGAGTIAQALRAGVPSVVVPFGLDQDFWGRRIQALGAGPQPIARKNLTPEKLAATIRQVLDNPDYRTNAAALGERLRTEDGTARAADIIERGSPL